MVLLNLFFTQPASRSGAAMAVETRERAAASLVGVAMLSVACFMLGASLFQVPHALPSCLCAVSVKDGQSILPEETGESAALKRCNVPMIYLVFVFSHLS